MHKKKPNKTKQKTKKKTATVIISDYIIIKSII